MKKTYQGSCHCGAVRYQTDLDLNEGTFKCNCSICTKTRTWLATVSPDAFRLLTSEAELTEYQFNQKSIHHLFCKHCGVRSFGWGEDSGNKFYAIHVTCLDDVEMDELVNAPITYVDGRHDNWRSPPTEIRHL
ncbi:GFA family protein [Leptothermofonsia sichuanensis E412]|uniref:GFA family protein n=1 Tax=Leptothermofonsia sichuanensis TaxID=2917832 RepID=UPI001CA769F6|nr:GFA family protein [Leptothermofonsia sichuanensis]QZZ19640.1 GFA family protein [Leptothermofonsia sichuanensis E412]